MAHEKTQGAGTATEDAPGENTVQVTFLPEGKTVQFELGKLPYEHHGKEHTEYRDRDRENRQPDDVVLDRMERPAVSEDLYVVVESNEGLTGSVEQAANDGRDNRVDDEDPDEDCRGGEEADGGAIEARGWRPSRAARALLLNDRGCDRRDDRTHVAAVSLTSVGGRRVLLELGTGGVDVVGVF